MKLDGESAYCQQTVACKPDSKIVECNNIVNDTVEHSDDEVPCDLKGNGKDVSSEMNRDGLWNVTEFDCSTSDDSTNGNEDEVRDYGEAYNHSSSPIDVDLYDAKSVMECELPEIIVCYKESHDNVIKDICIDQGVTSLGKILFGDAVDEDKSVTMSTPDDYKDSVNQCATVDPVQVDGSVTKATEEKGEPLETEDFMPELDENGVNKQSVQIPDEEAVLKENTFVSAVEKSILSPALQESNKSSANDIVCDSKVEGGIVTLNIDSSTPLSKLEDDHQIVSNQVRNSLGESSFSMAGAGGARNSLGESSFSMAGAGGARNSLGESSFSMAGAGGASFSMAGPGGASFSVTGPLSGLISYSGPIAYSGSCSLRSDSSTTSTRSFAFPVLQNEWNSSPVRMRKADRRKHWGWREGLLCCRF